MNYSQLYIGINREVKNYINDLELTSADITYWLNKAINEYVDEKAADLDKIEEIKQALKGLVDSGTISVGATTSIDSDSNRTVYALPDTNTRVFLSERVAVTYTSGVKSERVQPVTFDQLNIKIEDPYSMHFNRMDTCTPLRYLEDSDIILVSDSTLTLGNYSYIRLLSPTPFTISNAENTSAYTELPDKAHSEIITRAVRMIVENTDPQRYQVYLAEEQKSKQ